MKFYRFVLFLGVAAALSACSNKGDSGGDSGPSPKQLVAMDLESLKSVDEDAIDDYDRSARGLFSRIYGGTSATAIRNYLDARIRYYLSQEELQALVVSPSHFTNDRWMSDGSNVFGAEMGAANIGTALWLSGLVDGVPVSVTHAGQIINVDSARTGLMLIGPGYRYTLNVRGQTVVLPSAYREGILLHEARHSDCTGGITQDDLSVLRSSRSMRETDRRFQAKACGHLHTYCPLGHEYEGLLACDDHPWGPYAVQYIFVRALASSYSGVDRAVMDANAADLLSRLRFNTADMLNGRLGEPDMTNGGLH